MHSDLFVFSAMYNHSSLYLEIHTLWRAHRLHTDMVPKLLRNPTHGKLNVHCMSRCHRSVLTCREVLKWVFKKSGNSFKQAQGASILVMWNYNILPAYRHRHRHKITETFQKKINKNLAFCKNRENLHSCNLTAEYTLLPFCHWTVSTTVFFFFFLGGGGLVSRMVITLHVVNEITCVRDIKH